MKQYGGNHQSNANAQKLASNHGSAGLHHQSGTRETFGEFPLFLSYGHRIDSCGASVICREIIRSLGGELSLALIGNASGIRFQIKNDDLLETIWYAGFLNEFRRRHSLFPAVAGRASLRRPRKHAERADCTIERVGPLRP